MIYLFKCGSCNKNFEIEKKMSEEFKSEQLVCNVCGDILKRDYNAESHPVQIPEHMKADWSLNPRSRFNYDKRPSGRTDSHYVNGLKK